MNEKKPEYTPKHLCTFPSEKKPRLCTEEKKSESINRIFSRLQ